MHVGECTEIAESVMFNEKRGEGQLTEQVAGGWVNGGVLPASDMIWGSSEASLTASPAPQMKGGGRGCAVQTCWKLELRARPHPIPLQDAWDPS